MKPIYKGAQKDAKMVHKIVRHKMSFLHWVKSHELKVKAAEITKEAVLNEPDVGIRDTAKIAYNEDERQLYWKAFHDEYARLNNEQSVIP